jgi:type IV secretion system protein VirB10
LNGDYHMSDNEDQRVELTMPSSLNEAVNEAKADAVDPILDRPTADLKPSNKLRNTFLALGGIGAAIILVVSGITALKNNKPKEEPAQTAAPAAVETGQTVNKADLSLPPPPPPLPEEIVPEPTAPVPETKPPEPVQAAKASGDPDEITPAMRKMGGAIMIETGGSGGSNTVKTSQTDNPASPNGDSGGAIGDKLKPTLFSPSTAGIRGDTSLILTRGSLIPCVLVSKIVTTYPSITRCQTTKDVYSSNGKTLLLERGSVIMGEQQSALLQGQARVYVLWTTVETPNGIVINIDSGGTDALGAAGHPAFVDTQFWKRFGGGLLISLISDFSAALANSQTAKNADGVTFDNTNDNATSMAEKAIENTINIAPTGYIDQGTLLNIMVARDLSFSRVYEVISEEDF